MAATGNRHRIGIGDDGLRFFWLLGRDQDFIDYEYF